MINHVLAFVTIAFTTAAFWLLFQFGFLSSTERVLIGVIMCMGYHLLVIQGRVIDLENKVKE